MHLYPILFIYNIYAIVLLKQYLISIYAHLTKYTIILNFNFSHTILSSLVHIATLNSVIIRDNDISYC